MAFVFLSTTISSNPRPRPNSHTKFFYVLNQSWLKALVQFFWSLFLHLLQTYGSISYQNINNFYLREKLCGPKLKNAKNLASLMGPCLCLAISSISSRKPRKILGVSMHLKHYWWNHQSNTQFTISLGLLRVVA